MTTTKTPRTSLPRRTLLATAAAVLGLAATPTANATSPVRDLVDMQVVDRDSGQVARVWRHAGRLYVAGRPGARYSVRVTNNTPGRVLVVMSVDGVNILTGETAGYNQRGYVFGPYETYDVAGWRKSDTEIAAFNFAPLSRSYAARTGRPNDVGVIGLAAFTERTPYYAAPAAVSPQYRDRSAAADAREESAATGRADRSRAAPPPPAPSSAARAEAQSMRRTEKLGTGHGAREWSVVTTVPFERDTSYPQQVRQIEYDSYANLVAAGVIPRARPTPTRPRPFPDGGGYVPDPPYGG